MPVDNEQAAIRITVARVLAADRRDLQSSDFGITQEAARRAFKAVYTIVRFYGWTPK